MKLHSVHTCGCELEGARVWTNSRIARAARGLPGLWPCHVILKKNHVAVSPYFFLRCFSMVFLWFSSHFGRIPSISKMWNPSRSSLLHRRDQRRGSALASGLWKTSSGSPTTSGKQRPGRSERRTSKFRWGKNDDFWWSFDEKMVGTGTCKSS